VTLNIAKEVEVYLATASVRVSLLENRVFGTKSLEWALIQCDVFIKRGNLGRDRQAQRMEETQRGDGCLQAEE
jgi:hypothetical protein